MFTSERERRETRSEGYKTNVTQNLTLKILSNILIIKLIDEVNLLTNSISVNR